jgi:hypothetical protein
MRTRGYPCPMVCTKSEISRIEIVVIDYFPFRC